MGLLSWFRSGRQQREATPDPDAVFGPLVPDDDGMWVGEGLEFLPGLPPVSVTVLSGGTEPSPEARDAYLELRQRYPALASAVAERLFTPADNRYRRFGVTSAEDLWRYARLRHVTVEASREAPWFELGYDMPWDPEHSYIVEIEEWEAVRVSCDG